MHSNFLHSLAMCDFSVFSPNTGKYGPEKIPYLDTFHGVYVSQTANIGYDSSDYLISTEFAFVSKGFCEILCSKSFLLDI